MNNRFTLPIAAAVAVHASLMFGFRHPAAALATSDKSALKPASVITFLPTPEPPTPSDSTPEALGSLSEQPARLPEKFATPMDSPFTITPPETSGLVSDPRIFDLSPPGVPGGDPTAIRTSNIYSIAGLDKAPSARLQAAPEYPFSAKREGLNGEVTVEFLVDETGRVSQPFIVRSSNPVFDEPSLRAVLKWRFEPGRRDGTVVRFRMAVPLVFRLNND
jgi:periplasmic protein TonB